MSDVIHKTNFEIRESVNTPDFPAGTWLINPIWNPDKATIKAVPQLHRKITGGDTAEEMNAAEKLANPLPINDDAVAEAFKSRVRLATVAALPANTRTGNLFEADANGALPTIDGVAPALKDRILDKDHATSANRGIIIITQLGDGSNPARWQRANDSDTSGKVMACETVLVAEGTANNGLQFALSTNDPITLNTTALTYVKVPKTNDGGTGTGDVLSAAEIDTRIAAAVVGLYDNKGSYDANTNTPDLDTSPSGVNN